MFLNKTKKVFLSLFSIVIVLTISFACFAMEERNVPFSQTIQHASGNQSFDILSYQPNSQIHYQQTPGMPVHLAKTYDLINTFLDKVETTLKQMPGFTENQDNFIQRLLADQTEQSSIAQRAKVEIEFVHLYLSRASAARIKNCSSQREMYEKHKFFSSHLTPLEKSQLLAFATYEDFILSEMYSLRHSLSNSVAYQDKAPEFIIHPQDKTKIAALRQIGRAGIPVKGSFICKPKQIPYLLAFQEAPADIEGMGLISTENVKPDIKKAHALLKKCDTAPFGYQMLYECYQTLTGQTASHLREYLSLVSKAVQYPLLWYKLLHKCLLKSLIDNALEKTKDDLLNPSAETYNKHITAHLLQLLADTTHQSLPINCSQLFYLAEHIIATQLLIAGDLSQNPVEAIKKIKLQKKKQLELLNTVNTFLDKYESEFIPWDKHIRQEGITDPTDDNVHLPTIFLHTCDDYVSQATKERLLNIDQDPQVETQECSYSEHLMQLYPTDQQLVEHLMQTVFAPQPQKQQQPQKKPRKKSKQKRKQPKASTPSTPIDKKENGEPETIADTPTQDDLSCKIQQLRDIHYDWRIRRWFNPQFASQFSEESRLYHTFAPIADAYIYAQGRQYLRISPQHPEGQKQFNLPGKIIHANGAELFVVFQCTIDRNNYCYHRGYEVTSQEEIESTFNIKIPEEYTDAAEISHVSHHDKRVKDNTIIKAVTDKFVLIHDENNNADIILYRI